MMIDANHHDCFTPPGISESEVETVSLDSYLLVRWLTTLCDLCDILHDKKEADDIAAAEAAAAVAAAAAAEAEAEAAAAAAAAAEGEEGEAPAE